jgi:hypothetical protein
MRAIVLSFFMLSISFSALSQRIISGYVSDDFGPLEGANIIIKNTNLGAVSDIDGYYEIETKKNDTLSISFIGYETKDVLVANKKDISVTLKGGVALDEIVLVAYGAIRKTCVLRCNNFITSKTECSFGCPVEGFNVHEVNDNKSFNAIALYPNPSKSGIFELSLLNEYRKVQIQINNMSGQLIKTINHQNINRKIYIDLSQFPTGIYIISIIGDGKRLPAKKAIIG